MTAVMPWVHSSYAGTDQSDRQRPAALNLNAHVRSCRSFCFRFRQVGHRRLGQQHARHRDRVLQRDANDLGRIDDPGFDEINISIARDIEAEVPFPPSILATTAPPSTAELSAIWWAGTRSARLRT